MLAQQISLIEAARRSAAELLTKDLRTSLALGGCRAHLCFVLHDWFVRCDVQRCIDLTVSSDAYQPLWARHSCHLTPEAGGGQRADVLIQERLCAAGERFERAPRPPEACAD